MADLFDALAARALGIAPVLAPALLPRFAEPAGELELGELAGAGEPAALGDHPPPPVAGAPTTTEAMVRLERSQLDALAPSADPAAQPSRRSSPILPATAAPPLHSVEPPRVERMDVVETADRAAEPAHRRGRLSRMGEAAAPAPLLTARPEPDATPGAPEPDRSPSSEQPRPATERAVVVEQLRALPAPTDPLANGPKASHAEPSGEPEPGIRVTVSIGRVEVRAPARATLPPPTQRPRWPEPRLSLQDYLRQEGRR
jgi:hypothetical protein